jgi:general stress protein 26
MSTENLYNKEAQDKLRKIVDEVSVAMMATNIGSKPLSVIPMDTKKVDEDGNIWFLSGADSDHNRDIKNDKNIQLLYSSPSDMKFLSVYGNAEIITDNSLISKIYDKADNAYLNGADNPNTTAIKFYPKEAVYWDSDENKIVVLFKIVKAALSGKNQDIGTTGSLKL